MKKIIIRRKDTPSAEISSNFIRLTSEYYNSTRNEFINILGWKRILKEILYEDELTDELDNSILYKKYRQIYKSNEDNDHFFFAYKLNNDLAISITEHIIMYHLITDLEIKNEQLLPWYYYSGEKQYLADSWFYSDNEIIADFSNLSFIDFIVKYKCY